MLYPYIVVDNTNDKIEETLHKIGRFSNFYCVGIALNSENTLNLILEKHPQIIFLGLDSTDEKNTVLLSLLGQLHQFLDELPFFVILADSEKHAYSCIKAGVFDYLLRPLEHIDMLKCLLRFQKGKLRVPVPAPEAVPPSLQPVEIPQESTPVDDTRICIKSYGDYQFISLNDVMYLKADNNTTDFYLQSGRKLTAYKTLKHYENNLPSNFYRIHNSYIVNSDFITRISTGKSLCFLNGNEVSVSFSKTYKENIDILIRNISTEYL